MSETVRASQVRRGVWIWPTTEPGGWFKVTHVMAVPERPNGRTVRIAVNGRGPRYEVFHAPDDRVTVRFDQPS